MADVIALWDRRNHEHRAAFARLLAPLIAASRTKDYETPEKATVQLHTWMLSLEDVPESVLADAIAGMVRVGVSWMPKPRDVREACAKVIAKRRADAAKQHQDCDICHGSRWVDTDRGLDRCGCHRRIMAAMDAVHQPLALPPSASEDSL